MKKSIIILLVLMLATIGSAFAADFEEGSTNPTMKWSFSPEVSTTAGFNLDNNAFGLTGAGKVDIEAVIRDKATQEFKGEGTNYGYVKVEDLKVRIYADDATENDYDTNTNNDKADLLQLSVGSISGKVFMGPAYIVLHADNTAVNFIESLDDGDLDFTNINYSVIPAHWTGKYSGKEVTYPNDNPDNLTGDAGVISTADALANESVNNDSIMVETGGLVIGLSLPDLLTLELAYKTRFGFKGNDQYTYKYNPFALSLLIDINAVENLTAKIKAAAHAGNQVTITDLAGASIEDSGLMDENNPLTAGILLGYALSVGDNTLTPKLGFEIQMENKHKLNNSSLQIAQGSAIDNVAATDATDAMVDNGKISTMSYEGALGITYDWKSKGLSADESDHLSMAGDDVKVTDGVSLSAVYGVVPYKDIRNLQAPYIGVKLALWESEDTDKPGAISGLKAGFITNVNYTLGGTYDATDEFKAGDKNIFKKYEIEYGSRMDVGVGLETSYQVGAVKPYLGAILKMYDLTDATQKTTTQTLAQEAAATAGATGATAITETKISDTTRMINKGDVRLKLGFEITKVVSNTTFTVEYQSGNLVREALTEAERESLSGDDEAFFKNNPGSSLTDPMNNSNVRAGYISAGIKVSF